MRNTFVFMTSRPDFLDGTTPEPYGPCVLIINSNLESGVRLFLEPIQPSRYLEELWYDLKENVVLFKHLKINQSSFHAYYIFVKVMGYAPNTLNNFC